MRKNPFNKKPFSFEEYKKNLFIYIDENLKIKKNENIDIDISFDKLTGFVSLIGQTGVGKSFLSQYLINERYNVFLGDGTSSAMTSDITIYNGLDGMKKDLSILFLDSEGINGTVPKTSFLKNLKKNFDLRSFNEKRL